MQKSRIGRPRKNYSCPKCGKQGYKEKSASRNGNYPNSKYRKYWRVVHYDSFTKKKKFCYIHDIIWVKKNKELLLAYKRKFEQMSPTEFQEYALKMRAEHKRLRDNMKVYKEILEYVVTKYNITLPKEE